MPTREEMEDLRQRITAEIPPGQACIVDDLPDWERVQTMQTTDVFFVYLGSGASVGLLREPTQVMMMMMYILCFDMLVLAANV